MKTLAVLLLLGLAGYLAYQYADTPAPIVAPQRHSATQSKQAEPDPAEEEPLVPDLNRVPVKAGMTLTHARVKEVHPGGIVFVADQGLFKVGFDRLPEIFQAYYGPMAVPEPEPPSPPSPSPVDPALAPAAAKPRPQRDSLEDAQAALAYAQRKASLEGRISQDSATIDLWYKQSSFEKGGLTEQQYQDAQADIALASAQLAQLEADGP
jgi:hypothetical protein